MALNRINKNGEHNTNKMLNSSSVIRKAIYNKIVKESENSLIDKATDIHEYKSPLTEVSSCIRLDSQFVIAAEKSQDISSSQNKNKISKNEQFFINSTISTKKSSLYNKNNDNISINPSSFYNHSPPDRNLCKTIKPQQFQDHKEFFYTNNINFDERKSKSISKVKEKNFNYNLQDTKVMKSFKEEVYNFHSSDVLDKGKIDFTEYYFTVMRKTCSSLFFMIDTDKNIKCLKYPFEDIKKENEYMTVKSLGRITDKVLSNPITKTDDFFSSHRKNLSITIPKNNLDNINHQNTMKGDTLTENVNISEVFQPPKANSLIKKKNKEEVNKQVDKTINTTYGNTNTEKGNDEMSPPNNNDEIAQSLTLQSETKKTILENNVISIPESSNNAIGKNMIEILNNSKIFPENSKIMKDYAQEKLLKDILKKIRSSNYSSKSNTRNLKNEKLTDVALEKPYPDATKLKGMCSI